PGSAPVVPVVTLPTLAIEPQTKIRITKNSRFLYAFFALRDLNRDVTILSVDRRDARAPSTTKLQRSGSKRASERAVARGWRKPAARGLQRGSDRGRRGRVRRGQGHGISAV